MPLAARLAAPQTLELEDRPPLEPGPHEVVVAVEHAGICGTDLALYNGDYQVPLPLVCGHEFVGVVTDAGTGVDPQWVGRRVTAEINNTCLVTRAQAPCAACRKNLSNHCLRRTVTGIIRQDGAFAQQVRVPADTLHAIPDTLDPLTATLTEPLAAALQTFVMTPVTGQETVVVLGAGRLGILIIFVAALKGLPVVAVTRSQARQERAQRMGAAHICDPKSAPDRVRDLTEGLGADIVVDATGNPEGLPQAMELVRPRGTISVKTTCGLPAAGFDLTRLVVNETCLQGSRCGPFEPALEILAQHQQKLRPLITSTRPLRDIREAMESAFREAKVVLNIHG